MFFYLPCKIWRLNLSKLQKIFIRVKVYLCRLQIVFSMLQKYILCSFDWNYFYVFLQTFPKNANYKHFWTKYVNINNHTHPFLHGVVMLQEAKKYSQQEEIFTALWKKITFCRVDKKDYSFYLPKSLFSVPLQFFLLVSFTKTKQFAAFSAILNKIGRFRICCWNVMNKILSLNTKEAENLPTSTSNLV